MSASCARSAPGRWLRQCLCYRGPPRDRTGAAARAARPTRFPPATHQDALEESVLLGRQADRRHGPAAPLPPTGSGRGGRAGGSRPVPAARSPPPGAFPPRRSLTAASPPPPACLAAAALSVRRSRARPRAPAGLGCPAPSPGRRSRGHGAGRRSTAKMATARGFPSRVTARSAHAPRPRTSPARPRPLNHALPQRGA